MRHLKHRKGRDLHRTDVTITAVRSVDCPRPFHALEPIARRVLFARRLSAWERSETANGAHIYDPERHHPLQILRGRRRKPRSRALEARAGSPESSRVDTRSINLRNTTVYCKRASGAPMQ